MLIKSQFVDSFASLRFKMFLKLFLLIFTLLAFAESQERIEDVAFINVGSFTGADGHLVKYFVPRYFKASWDSSRSICQSYGMEFLTIESEAEQNYLLDTLKFNSAVFSGNWVNIGGMTTSCGSRDLWYWVDTGNKVNFPIRWHANDPNCSGDSEPCMAMGKFEDGNVYVVDIWCSGIPQKFLCKQKSVVFTR